MVLLRSLAFVILLAACAEDAPSGGLSGESPAPQSATLELRATEKAPEGVLTWQGETYEGELGTHCWTTMCVDFIGPPEPKAYAPVPGDLEMELTGDGKADSVTVGRAPKEPFGSPKDERELEVRTGRITFDLEPGRYVLVVFATWAGQGDAVLTFGLDVS